MEKCRRMRRQLCMSKNWICSWLWKSSKTRQQYCLLESFAMKTDILMNGSMVKNHISLKTGFGYSATRRTSFRWWFLVWQRVLPPVLILQHPWHLQGRKLIILRLPQPHLLHQLRHLQLCQATATPEHEKTCVGRFPSSICVKWTCWKERTGRPVDQANQNPKPNKNEDHDLERADPLCSDIPEWLQEFRENLVDDRVPERRDSRASSSHEPSLESTFKRREDLCKHSVYTHFHKDRNCEICKWTKITRAPCRRRNGEAVPRAGNFGDLITADHKVLSDNFESQNNHRYAVVVQDLATLWIQAYPCKT